MYQRTQILLDLNEILGYVGQCLQIYEVRNDLVKIVTNDFADQMLCFRQRRQPLKSIYTEQIPVAVNCYICSNIQFLEKFDHFFVVVVSLNLISQRANAFLLLFRYQVIKAFGVNLFIDSNEQGDLFVLLTNNLNKSSE